MTRLLLVHEDLVILMESDLSPAALAAAIERGEWALPPSLAWPGVELKAVRLGRLVIATPLDFLPQSAGAPPPLPARPGPPVSLSDRQRLVLQGLADGQTHRQIAARLGVSERTVSQHAEALRRRFGTTSQMQTVLRAYALGLCKIKHPS